MLFVLPRSLEAPPTSFPRCEFTAADVFRESDGKQNVCRGLLFERYRPPNIVVSGVQHDPCPNRDFLEK